MASVGMRGLGRERTRRIHAFHDAAFWITLMMPVFFAPVIWIITGDGLTALVAAAFSLAFACLVSATITDLMSMRIPNPLTALSFVPAFLWWLALALGFDAPDVSGFGRDIYAPILVGAGSGALMPDFWTGTLTRDIVMSIAGAVLVFIPLLASFIIGAMGGGDAKFIPPFALLFGWSLGFDFLFLTFLFGGLFAVPMLVIRQIFRYLVKMGNTNETVQRVAKMKSFAYAPAIAAAGIVCFAAFWQGFFG